jgi:hypothetical protein
MKQHSSTGMHTKGCVPDTTQWVLLIQWLLDMYANFSRRSKHSGVEIFIYDENVKEFHFIKIFEDASIYKKVSGSAKTYF